MGLYPKIPIPVGGSAGSHVPRLRDGRRFRDHGLRKSLWPCQQAGSSLGPCRRSPSPDNEPEAPPRSRHFSGARTMSSPSRITVLVATLLVVAGCSRHKRLSPEAFFESVDLGAMARKC